MKRRPYALQCRHCSRCDRRRGDDVAADEVTIPIATRTSRSQLEVSLVNGSVLVTVRR